MKKLVLALLLLGCHRPAPSTADGSPASSSCAASVASYDALVAAGGACKVDGDCECFVGGVSTKTPCGGVTDRATAAKLESVRADYEHAQCDALMCAASLCSPKCVAGKCANGSGSKP